ncbi:unnamed protein product [Soboliphyme baturini]|uniref:Transmembrane protein n=1 Tax=Soboliphyme baturini TaxID=241478 RepID=A0A183IUR6_9BILA|nr:unnamed protein product [Soboliphyme baturini]
MTEVVYGSDTAGLWPRSVACFDEGADETNRICLKQKGADFQAELVPAGLTMTVRWLGLTTAVSTAVLADAVLAIFVTRSLCV